MMLKRYHAFAKSRAALLIGGLWFCAQASGADMNVTNTAKQTGPEPAKVKVRLLDPSGRLTAPQLVPKVVQSETDWRKVLTSEQFEITRGKGTERAFCGVFYDHKKPGLYTCVGCGLPLFSSEAKFNSGSGWPSFFAPVAPENVATRPDGSLGMNRTEILCARCDAHLGHVFEDGPRPTGLRYCLNSAALVFTAKDKQAKDGTGK